MLIYCSLFQHWQSTKDNLSCAGNSWNRGWSHWLFSWVSHLWALPSHCGTPLDWRGGSQWCWTVWTISGEVETVYQHGTAGQLTKGGTSMTFSGIWSLGWSFHLYMKWLYHWQSMNSDLDWNVLEWNRHCPSIWTQWSVECACTM